MTFDSSFRSRIKAAWSLFSFGRKTNKPCVIWLTGLCASGKTTLAREVSSRLWEEGYRSVVLDGDELRAIFGDSGFSREERIVHGVRVAELAALLERQGYIVLVALVSPYEEMRRRAKALSARFYEIYINTPLEVCEKRDPKGLYKKARAGLIPDFTGISQVYEAPIAPSLSIDTSQISTDEAVRRVLALFMKKTADPRLEVLKRLPTDSVGAEVGVWKGDFSRKILKVVRPRKLHLIDPWAFQPDYPKRWYGGLHAKSQADMNRIFTLVSSRLGRNKRVSVHRGYSSQVLKSFEDSSLDWIYIDGNHSYEHVTEDLELAFRKVGRGGFVAGDDFDWQEAGDYPTRRAVEDFVKKHGSSVEIIGSSQYLISKS